MGEQTIHTVSTATGGFSVGHFAEFDYAGKAIVGVIESIEPDGSLTLGCGLEGRWVMPAAECRPWGPPLGALPGDLPTEADGRPPFRAGDRVQWVVDGVMNGIGTVRQYPYRDAFVRPTLVLVHFDGDPYPLTAQIKDLTLIPTDSAGPASSSASTGGTGGLADTAARLAGSAKDLARLARDVREELEGRRRELWDALVGVVRLAEIGFGAESNGYANGFQRAYHLVTGIGGEELERLLNAELDSRYGADRAKGGEPRD